MSSSAAESASEQPGSDAPPVKRRAQLVMGEALPVLSDADKDSNGLPLESASAETTNEEILMDLPDDTLELELTHLRLKTLRGLGLHRFANVQRISLRQNLLSSLSYTPAPAVADESQASNTLSSLVEQSAPSPSEDTIDPPIPIISSHEAAATASSSSSHLASSSAPPPPTVAGDLGAPMSRNPHPDADAVDEDPNDDEDAIRKESEFEYHTAEPQPSASSSNSRPIAAAEEHRQWPLRNLKELDEIDLYDNRLKSLRGLEGLDSLTSLDLSFNLLRSLSPLVDEDASSPFAYPLLTHLYLIQNKLSKIEGVQHRHSIVYLEFGGNRIRTIENLPRSAALRSLFLGKNKITKIEGLEGLSGLTTLSIQSNRITKIEGLSELTELSELYLSHNGITKIEGLESNTKLTTLDVGNNKIDSFEIAELANLTLLEEFWANDNALAVLPILPPSSHPNLQTIYLEGNPIMKSLAGNYRRKVMMEMPQVGQIDAGFVGKRM